MVRVGSKILRIITMTTPTYYSSADYKNVGQLLNILAGLGVVSLGAGAAYSGIKNYQNRFMEATAPDYLRPSKLVRNRSKDKRITIDETYLPDTEKTAQCIGRAMRQSYQKKAGLNKVGFDWVGAFKAGIKEDKNPERSWWDYFAGRDYISEGAEREYNRQGITFHDLSKLNDSNSTPFQRFKANLATAPAMRSAWFLPAATAAVLGGAYLGYHGVNYLNKLFGKHTRPTMDYSERARKIYNESAQYLKDTVEGKDLDEISRKKKKESIKESSFIKSADPILSGNGSSSFWGLGALIGIPAAMWVARQMRAFGSGIDSAKEELADRTHMIRAWQAAAKERQYDYNNFDAELATEPLKDNTAKRIQKKERDFINETDKDDDNNNQLRYENYVFNNIRKDRNALT